VSNSPSFDDEPVLHFFTTSTRNLLATEQAAGVGHHVALSVVGADGVPDSGYLRAKADVATAVTRAAIGRPINGTTEIAGPETFGMDDFIRTGLAAREDPRQVVTDPAAPCYGAVIDDHSIVPGRGATIFETRFTDWLVSSASAARS